MHTANPLTSLKFFHMGYVGVHTLPHPSPGHIRDTEGLNPCRAASAPATRNPNRTPETGAAAQAVLVAVAPGISLGYRRNAGPGAWNVRAADGKGGNWIKSFAIADDHEDADGANVLTFWQAADKAKALARGQDADAGRPATVDEALTDYATDLAVRGAGPTNATGPRHHLTPAAVEAGVDVDGERAAALAQRARQGGEGIKRQPAVQVAEGRAQSRRFA